MAETFTKKDDALSIEDLLDLPYTTKEHMDDNKQIVTHLKSLVLDKRATDDWGIHVPIIQRIINTMFHTSTGTTPSKLVYGSQAISKRNFIDAVARGRVPMAESTSTDG